MDQTDNTCVYWPKGEDRYYVSPHALQQEEYTPPLKSSCQKVENQIKALPLIMFPGNRTEKQSKLYHGDTIGKNSHWEILQKKDLVSPINKLQGGKKVNL